MNISKTNLHQLLTNENAIIRNAVRDLIEHQVILNDRIFYQYGQYFLQLKESTKFSNYLYSYKLIYEPRHFMMPSEFIILRDLLINERIHLQFFSGFAPYHMFTVKIDEKDPTLKIIEILDQVYK